MIPRKYLQLTNLPMSQMAAMKMQILPKKAHSTRNNDAFPIVAFPLFLQTDNIWNITVV